MYTVLSYKEPMYNENWYIPWTSSNNDCLPYQDIYETSVAIYTISLWVNQCKTLM